MSATRTTRRLVPTLAVLSVTVGLTVVGSSTASAHRGVYDSDTCQESLTRVWDWPGEIETESGRIVLFSDAYESYILRQPPCSSTHMPTPRWDPNQVGHQRSVGTAPTPDLR